MAAPDWQIVGGNVLACDSARMAIQRIGLAHWQPTVKLRSWGIAPLHVEATKLSVPCAEDEALWLGLWSESVGNPVSLRIVDVASGAYAIASTTAGDTTAITALRASALEAQPADADPQSQAEEFEPLVRLRSPERRFALNLDGETHLVYLTLLLLPPADWAMRAGRPAPAPLRGPPPLPPRLG